MDMIIRVDGQTMIPEHGNHAIIAGTHNYIRARFLLSRDWDGMDIIARWTQGDSTYDVPLDENHAAMMPVEIVPGTCALTLCGKSFTETGWITGAPGETLAVYHKADMDVSAARLYIPPRQSGSGVPSATNIRPIITTRAIDCSWEHMAPGDTEWIIGDYSCGMLFPRQYYCGAMADLVDGKVYVTHSYIGRYAGEALPGKWLSDRDVYSPNTLPSIGAEVVYERETMYVEDSSLSPTISFSEDGNYLIKPTGAMDYIVAYGKQLVSIATTMPLRLCIKESAYAGV